MFVKLFAIIINRFAAIYTWLDGICRCHKKTFLNDQTNLIFHLVGRLFPNLNLTNIFLALLLLLLFNNNSKLELFELNCNSSQHKKKRKKERENLSLGQTATRVEKLFCLLVGYVKSSKTSWEKQKQKTEL